MTLRLSRIPASQAKVLFNITSNRRHIFLFQSYPYGEFVIYVNVESVLYLDKQLSWGIGKSIMIMSMLELCVMVVGCQLSPSDHSRNI